MKKIMMTKYGFERSKADDFCDDGSVFQCYRVGNEVIVSKCVSDGWAYIDGGARSYDLPYEVYSKLPHYKDIGKLNGIKVDALTEADLINLYAACVAYDQEYTAAKNSMVWPTFSEIKIQCMKVCAKRQEELAELGRRFNLAVALKLNEWEWKTIRDYILTLIKQTAECNPEKYPQTIVGTVRSVEFCKPDCQELQDSFYYKWIMEKINK